MLKYQITNARESKVSTAMIGTDRISLAKGEVKTISFTDYKRFEKSLESLETSRIITITKLTGQKAKDAKLSEFLNSRPVAEVVDEVEGDETQDSSDTTQDATVTPEGSEEVVDETEADDADKVLEGSEDEDKTLDPSDDTTTDDDTDVTTETIVEETIVEEKPPVVQPQNKNQGGRNRNRNRNK